MTKLGRKFWFRVLGVVVKHLSGKGLEQLSFVKKTYRFMVRHLIGEDIVLVDVHGQKMHVFPAFGLMLLSTGTYESERLMTTLFTELVAENMIVVDIGAYVGFYTLLAAKAVGDKGRVFCFEPELSNYTLLLKNIEENGYNNVVPVQKAVTNVTGPIKLFLTKDQGSHSIGNYDPCQKTIVVDSITLDEFFSRRDCSIHVMKIDVEGAEMAVLQGMANIISKNRQLKIFTEFNAEALKRAGFSPTEYFKMLVNYGFEVYVINEKKQLLEPAEIGNVIKMCKSIGYVNLLCQRV